MAIDRARGAVVILRASEPSAVPAWLRADAAAERLRDGSFVVAAGVHRIGDTSYAVRCIAESLSGDLGFHRDERGLRWLRFGPIASKPRVEVDSDELGSFSAFDLDYEACVSAVGLWVPLAKVTARRREQAVEAKRRELAAAQAAVPEPEPSDTGVQHRNVVVVRGAPKALPKEFVVLHRLPDGTVLGVGPRNRGWVDWLKKNVPAEALRLMKGPVSDSFLKELTSFEMLNAACQLQGHPLLVMRPS